MSLPFWSPARIEARILMCWQQHLEKGLSFFASLLFIT
jgi:hypothetical protein